MWIRFSFLSFFVSLPLLPRLLPIRGQLVPRFARFVEFLSFDFANCILLWFRFPFSPHPTFRAMTNFSRATTLLVRVLVNARVGRIRVKLYSQARFARPGVVGDRGRIQDSCNKCEAGFSQLIAVMASFPRDVP